MSCLIFLSCEPLVIFASGYLSLIDWVECRRCCRWYSFDAIGLENAGGQVSRSTSRGSSTTAGGETAGCLLLPSVPGRRGSFLYRSSDSDSELSPMSLSRKHSAANSDSSASVFTHRLLSIN